MASTYKTLLNDDKVNTRTLLHEAIPLTGTISSGTYQDANIKNFSHGMFQSVYDYPYLSSSANHIYDVTVGYTTANSSSLHTQNAKKVNIYNQMAQVLFGYDENGAIRKFDSDGTIDGSTTGQMEQCVFLNFSRLLSKDEIKKGSFRLNYYASGAMDLRTATKGLAGGDSVAGVGATSGTFDGERTLGDYDALNEFRTSPAGDYGLVFTDGVDTTDNSNSVGLIFYQAGIVVLTSSIFQGTFQAPGYTGTVVANGASHGQTQVATNFRSGTIEQLCDSFRMKVKNIEYNNTIELNSAVYFCRINHNEFNYSSNPTYVDSGKIVVKNNVTDLPVTYITTVGLYSADNELLAVAKLSEPIRKDPNTELTLRVRLDY
jgi:hypothetical protein